MKRFYNLLVRDSMEVDPDLEKIRKGSTADIKAIRNEFRNSKGFKVNLAFACVTKLIFSILFGIWILFISYGTIYTDGKSEPTINDSRVSYSSTPSKWSFIDYIQCTVAEVIYSQLILILLPYDDMMLCHVIVFIDIIVCSPLGAVFVYRTKHSVLFVPGLNCCIPRYTLHTGIIILSFVAYNH